MYGYAKNGALKTLALNNGVTEQKTFKALFQPTPIQAGGLLTLGYTYGIAQRNNGTRAMITRSGYRFTQTFGYDAMNR